MATPVTPDTLPADPASRDQWDSPPDTLPHDFSGWDAAPATAATVAAVPRQPAPPPQSASQAPIDSQRPVGAMVGTAAAIHPAGAVTAFDQHTGLPIVDRTRPSALVAWGKDLPPKTATAGLMSPEAEAISAAAAARASAPATGASQQIPQSGTPQPRPQVQPATTNGLRIDYQHPAGAVGSLPPAPGPPAPNMQPVDLMIPHSGMPEFSRFALAPDTAMPLPPALGAEPTPAVLHGIGQGIDDLTGGQLPDALRHPLETTQRVQQEWQRGQRAKALWDAAQSATPRLNTWNPGTEAIETGEQSEALTQRAIEDWQSGHRGNAVWHGIDAVLPILGPMDAAITDQYQSGDKSGAMARAGVGFLPFLIDPLDGEAREIEPHGGPPPELPPQPAPREPEPSFHTTIQGAIRDIPGARLVLPEGDPSAPVGQTTEGSAAGTTESEAPTKGSPVVLRDGRPGTVVYTDPRMKIARVRMEDGNTLTVPQSELQAVNGNRSAGAVASGAKPEGSAFRSVGDKEKLAAIGRSQAENARGFTGEVIYPFGPDPVLRASIDTLILLDKILKEPPGSNALILAHGRIVQVVGELRRLTAEQRSLAMDERRLAAEGGRPADDAAALEAAQGFAELGDAISRYRSPEGTTILVRSGLPPELEKRALREEFFHKRQIKHGLYDERLLDYINDRLYEDHPKTYRQARRALAQIGYKGKAVAFEVPAWIAAGAHSALGLTVKEAADILKTYLARAGERSTSSLLQGLREEVDPVIYKELGYGH